MNRLIKKSLLFQILPNLASKSAIVTRLKKTIVESFNSDPHLIYNKQTDELWLYFRSDDGYNSKIFLRKSPNGIDWSEKLEILASRFRREHLSPSILMQENRFWMWTVNASTDLRSIDLRISSDGERWSQPVRCCIDNLGGERTMLWHLNVKYNAELEEYWGLFVISDCLRFARSKNGKDWRMEPFPKLCPTDSGWDNYQIYRAACLVDEEKRSWIVWYSAANDKNQWYIGRTHADYTIAQNGNCVWVSDFFNTKKHQLTPTYDGSGQAVHPSLVYFRDGWGNDRARNNWRYWLVMTPFPNKKERYENPSILVSNEGVKWRVPPGLKNPIEKEPGSFPVKLLRRIVLSQIG